MKNIVVALGFTALLATTALAGPGDHGEWRDGPDANRNSAERQIRDENRHHSGDKNKYDNHRHEGKRHDREMMRLFKQLDADDDMSVTEEEIRDGAGLILRALDRNGDGEINLDDKMRGDEHKNRYDGSLSHSPGKKGPESDENDARNRWHDGARDGKAQTSN